MDDDLDTVYRAKYRRYTTGIIDHVNGRQGTLRPPSTGEATSWR